MKTIKRILITLLSATMLLTAATAVCSAAPAEENITVTVNGQTVEFPDQKPFLRDDRTLVPIRFIAESLGYEVDWDAKENTALIDGGRIKLWIGTNRAELNGKKVNAFNKKYTVGSNDNNFAQKELERERKERQNMFK